VTGRVWLLVLVVGATAAALLGGGYFAVLVATAAFLGLLVVEWSGAAHRGALRPAAVYASVVGLMVLAVVTPPRQSRDVWAYAAYGDMVAHAHSPYRHGPEGIARAELVTRMHPRWRRSPSVYGPAFAVLSGAGMAATRGAPLPSRLYFQLVAALSVGGLLVLVARKTGDTVAVAAFGLNPLVVTGVVNSAHIDALASLALLGGVLLVSRARWRWAAVALAAAVMLKVIALLPAVACVLWVWSKGDRRRAGRLAAPMVVLVGAGYLLAGGAVALRAMTGAAHLTSAPSVWKSLDPGPVVTWGLVSLAAAALAWRYRDAESPEIPAAAAGMAFLLLAPYVLPWYSALVLPVALLQRRSALTAMMLGYSSLLLLAYFPSGSLDMVASWTHLFAVLLRPLEVVLVLVLLVMYGRRNRFGVQAASR